MKERFFKLLFKPSKVEHFRINQVNEYLIVYRKFLFFKRVEVFREIGASSREIFTERINSLRKRGVGIIEKEMTMEEFDQFSQAHPVLMEDSWAKKRKQVVEMGINRKR